MHSETPSAAPLDTPQPPAPTTIAAPPRRPVDQARARGRLLRLLSPAGGAAVTGLVVLGLLHFGLPAANALAAGSLVRALGAGQWSATTGPLALVAVILVVGQAVEAVLPALRTVVERRVEGDLRRRARHFGLWSADLDRLAAAEVRDELEHVTAEGAWRQAVGDGAVGQVLLLTRFAGALVAAVVLAAYFPLTAVVLLTTMVAIRSSVRRQWTGLARAQRSFASEQRRTRFWSSLAGGAAAAKETRVFGVGPWLVDRHREQALGWLEVMWRHRRDVVTGQWAVFLATAGAAAMALLVPASATLRGELSPGELTTCLLTAWAVFGIASMGSEAFAIEAALATSMAWSRLSAEQVDHRPVPGWDKRPDPGYRPCPEPPSIRFEGVRFGYAADTAPVLDGLDLDLPPGEVVALVGVNGAGKSTLISLLAGLRQPDAGRITADGHDLADVDRAAWNRTTAVVFQDFVRYPLSLRDNIGLAAPDAPRGDADLETALAGTAALDLRSELGLDWDTPLSAGLRGGRDLSGGQWQQVALARAVFAARAGRRVLVLDEPTSHLDVRAELDFHRAVIGAVAGATVLLISHRLSTVRHADRIALLAGGRIAEQGGHAELMARDGRYAAMFREQSRPFLDEEVRS